MRGVSVHLLKAFHGTNEINAEKILKDGFKKPELINNIKNTSLPGDLGFGVYSFADDKELAYDFIKRQCSTHQTPVVLELELMIEEKDILDFDVEDDLNTFLSFKKLTLESAKNRYKKFKTERKCLDGIIIEFMLSKEGSFKPKMIKKKTYTPLRLDFIEIDGKKRPLVSNFSNGVEYSIRDLSIIESKRKCALG